jgi:hypothetical protein
MRANNEISHPSTLENIDTAIYRFIDETLSPHTVTNAGREKVNVLWMGTERTFQIKNNKELRDKVGKLRLPLITVSRASVSRDDAFKGSVQAAYVGDGERIVIRKVIQQDKTQNFQNASRKRQEMGDDTGPVSTKKIVYETISIPKPTYLTCMFEINIRTEYQQQMNHLLPLFMNSMKNYFIIENNGYQYEAFIQDDYGLNSNQANLGQDERMFNAKVQIKVLGYINGNDLESNEPLIKREESIVEVKISRERVIVGDEKPWNKNGEKYRDL